MWAAVTIVGSFVYMAYNLLGKTPCRQVALPVKYLFLKCQKNIEWSQNQAPHSNFFIDHLQKLRRNSFIYLWILLLATERQTIMRQVDLILGHKKSYPFCVFLRQLDGATRLCYQGDNTISQWRNFIANCRIFKYCCDHCVMHIDFSTMIFACKVVCHLICLKCA